MTNQTIYISIGNSDDKLTQAEWAHFYGSVTDWIDEYATAVHGRWASEPTSPYQNACWCIEVNEGAWRLREGLAHVADTFRQDSIAWAPATTEFIAAKALDQ